MRGASVGRAVLRGGEGAVRERVSVNGGVKVLRGGDGWTGARGRWGLFLQQLNKQRRMLRGSACGDVGLSHPL
eukprot:2882757-Prymnesium_polylepis.1